MWHVSNYVFFVVNVRGNFTYFSFNFTGNSYSLASFFRNDSTPVITNQFYCNGNENSLSQCTSNSNSNECHSFQTYGIYCTGK